MFCSLTSLAIPGPKHDSIIERNVASLSRVAVRLARGEPAAMAVIVPRSGVSRIEKREEGHDTHFVSSAIRRLLNTRNCVAACCSRGAADRVDCAGDWPIRASW